MVLASFLGSLSFRGPSSIFLLQVKAPPKKKRKTEEEEEKSKEVVPETYTQKLQGVLQDMLKQGSDARMASIKLTNMEYAGELSNQLLGHAKKLEDLYKLSSDAIKSGADEPTLKKHLKTFSTLNEFVSNAQAGCFKLMFPSLPMYLIKQVLIAVTFELPMLSFDTPYAIATCTRLQQTHF